MSTMSSDSGQPGDPVSNQPGLAGFDSGRGLLCDAAESSSSGDTVRATLLLGGSLLLAAVLGTVGWAVVRPGRGSGGTVTTSVSAYPGVAAALASPMASRTVDSVRPRSSPVARASTRPTPISRPPVTQLPPAPPKRTDPGGSCPYSAGRDQPKHDVSHALSAAAAREYWPFTTAPAELAGPMPRLNTAPALMAALAWQESHWQSGLVGCGQRLGVMQLTPPISGWLNARFSTSYDVRTLTGNTALGVEYVQWLTLYFGLYYFGSYDMAATAPVGRGGTRLVLLDVVISAFSAGPAALLRDNGTPHAGDDWIDIPNPRYVRAVKDLMVSCPCLGY